jgi:hypothetical protein
VEVRFSVTAQASPEAYPASCKMSITSVFRGLKRPGISADHPPPCIVDTVNGLELYLSLPSVPYTGMLWGDLHIYPLLLRNTIDITLKFRMVVLFAVLLVT